MHACARSPQRALHVSYRFISQFAPQYGRAGQRGAGMRMDMRVDSGEGLKARGKPQSPRPVGV